MNKLLGWLALIGVGVFAYSQYKKAQKEKLNVAVKK